MKDLVTDNTHVEPVERESDLQLGNWFHVKEEDEDGWFGCITKMGTNFVEVESPRDERGYNSVRLHLEMVDSTLTYEPNPDKFIARKVIKYENLVKLKLGEVQSITARLGTSKQAALANPSGSNALMVLSGETNIDDYKTQLVKAKEEDLPKLFEEIKKGNQQLAKWMGAEALSLQVLTRGLEENIEAVEDRIFNISIYAGLVESTVHITKGEPAAFEEQVNLMQRKLFMDEECLVNYSAGGMEFNDITEFDDWLALDENLSRIMPFPKCVCIFQVRRDVKQRKSSNMLEAFINMQLAQSDKFSFLYIKNGDNLYRINSELDFADKVFPDKTTYNPQEPMMMKRSWNKIEAMMTVREYEDREIEYNKKKVLSEQWKKANPKEHYFSNPHRQDRDWSPSDWSLFDDTNLYFDECNDKISKEIKQYNRIALILQGLYDRSDVLHPHPKIKLWNPADFNTHINLVYDDHNVLAYGDAPDIEAYVAACNAQLRKGSITIGQDNYWELEEGEKECARRDNDWRDRGEYRPRRFRPYGNSGPGRIAEVVKWWPGKKAATFEWMRERRVRRHYGDDEMIATRITVPAEELFNISAYQKGDYVRFFQDHRTRKEYLKWAPRLLAAEDYLAEQEK